MQKSAVRVVITGYGGNCSLGENVDQIWDSISNYRLGYKLAKHNDQSVGATFFGNMETPLAGINNIPKAINRNLPRYGQFGIVAAEEAVRMAFGEQEIYQYYDPFDCGVIFGTGWGGQDEVVKNAMMYTETGMASPFSNIQAMYSVCTAAIAKIWNLRGYQSTPVAACATSSIAIGDAFELIKAGRAKMVLAGGGESIRDAFNIWSVDILQALSKEQNDVTKACCPFSLDRSGFIMSEGAAVVCLEEYESAKKRGANILAEITGYGNFSDAYDMTKPAPDLLGRVKSINKALSQANVSVGEIDYINAHGTSTPLNDLNETESLKLALGDYAYEIPVSSTKSYTGHLMAAAGSMETIFCIKSMTANMLPATTNLNNPDPACDLNYVANNHVNNEDIKTALNINYGFGGSNSALILQRI